MTIQAVVFIHGVGAQKKGYSKKIKKLITDKVDDFISGDAGLIFREVLWAPVTETHQKDLWKRVNKKGSGFDKASQVLRLFWRRFYSISTKQGR
jgi:hypothetical protein